MKYLLDANVLCEPTKPLPAQEALNWLQANVLDCVTDSIVLAEIWQGIDALPQGRKRTNLEAWFAGMSSRIRCLDWTLEVALRWGPLVNEVRRSGFTVGIKDTMIAASAAHHGLIIATRNVADFTRCGVPALNPFL